MRPLRTSSPPMICGSMVCSEAGCFTQGAQGIDIAFPVAAERKIRAYPQRSQAQRIFQLSDEPWWPVCGPFPR